jgi:purine nucleoside phosphorylase
VKEKTADADIAIKEGVYAGVPGPSLETEAECAFLYNMGSDLGRYVHHP